MLFDLGFRLFVRPAYLAVRYISIVIFMLPMYDFILRIQVEKGMDTHLEVLGLSRNA